ncbi:uncharacterized protein LOC126380908 [Pectinophora gossypiella]|uniref:uncharacterized protein LOC126371541 n=1 Tax=Pectinophora gossypiella TaxID=13191 RepID=UPI00214EE99C|nr:uncharacterized protein LOC126371541 [Pectinophora gossypiella]XP_049875827.1 uncharacterized protein LOC126373653 [Pectinophora gossypiella]XP_049886442.1 uncharacterized protein LOC126380907 [Pectinophora gossypiella]XP_049886443.1 uncharacterized protein LOC126380908 [Pectinophora gossypiella]
MSKTTADHLFASDDDEVEAVRKPENTKKRGKSSAASESSSSKKSKPSGRSMPSISPVPVHKKPTARELFGTDSEDETEEPSSSGNKKFTPLYSYLTRRVANGLARQADEDKKGSHYIEMKIYKCDEVEKVSAINRWRHAIVTIKNRTDDDTDAWQHLSKYISATRKEFKNCPPTFIGSYF